MLKSQDRSLKQTIQSKALNMFKKNRVRSAQTKRRDVNCCGLRGAQWVGFHFGFIGGNGIVSFLLIGSLVGKPGLYKYRMLAIFSKRSFLLWVSLERKRIGETNVKSLEVIPKVKTNAFGILCKS